MGLLVNGEWRDEWYDTEATGGEFVRGDAGFRDWVTAGGGAFPAEAGRYHLYVSLACPWAHRTLVMRKLKKLEAVIGVTVVRPEMLEKGWELSDEMSVALGYLESPVPGISTLAELYTRALPDYTGRVTVPVLWDTETGTIVSNESADILRMFNSAFNAFTEVKTDYYPDALAAGIDEINDYVYRYVNNGVYKAGFATSQDAYGRAFTALFEALDRLDARLSGQRYLMGDQPTEADWRLFTTLVRFDAVYYGHFKCNKRSIESYPNLSGYLRDLYQQPGVAETTHLEQIKRHYYYSHDTINPARIVPLGPELDYWRPHHRDRLAGKNVA